MCVTVICARMWKFAWEGSQYGAVACRGWPWTLVQYFCPGPPFEDLTFCSALSTPRMFAFKVLQGGVYFLCYVTWCIIMYDNVTICMAVSACSASASNLALFLIAPNCSLSKYPLFSKCCVWCMAWLGAGSITSFNVRKW